jgi:hypothetical protein
VCVIWGHHLPRHPHHPGDDPALSGWAVGSGYARRVRDENVLAAVAIQMIAAGVFLWIPRC